MLWVISELYYPEENSSSRYFTQIAEGLAEVAPVSVICCQPGYHQRGIRAPWSEKRHGVRIERCRATTFDKNVLPSRIVNLVTSTVALFSRALWRLNSGDVALVGTNPPTLAGAVALACRVKGAQCVLRMDDVYPEAVFNAGFMRPGGIPARALQRVARLLYERVNSIVVVGRDMQELVDARLGGKSSKVTVIPNWGDVQAVAVQPKGENRLLQELGLAEKFVIGYAGNVGPLQGIENLFATMVRLRDQRRLHFLVVGSGRKAEWLRKSVIVSGLQNVTMLGHRPRSEQSSFLNACDIGFISLVRGMAGVGVPSRLYNMLAAGKPIIAAIEDNAETARVVREERIGWVVPPDSPQELGAAIVEASSNPAILAQMGVRARAVAEAKYSLSQGVEAYRVLFRDVLKWGVDCELQPHGSM